MNEPNKVNKALEIAKSIDKDVQKLVNKLFEQCEATPDLLKKNPEVYFVHSNQIFSAIIASAAQRLLEDGLMRHKLGYKANDGTRLAWDLFLLNNPDIAKKVEEEKAAKEAKWKANAIHDEGDEPEDDEEPDEDSDEDEGTSDDND